MWNLDPDLECWSGEHEEGLPVAIVVALFVAAGIPVLVAAATLLPEDVYEEKIFAKSVQGNIFLIFLIASQIRIIDGGGG